MHRAERSRGNRVSRQEHRAPRRRVFGITSGRYSRRYVVVGNVLDSALASAADVAVRLRRDEDELARARGRPERQHNGHVLRLPHARARQARQAHRQDQAAHAAWQDDGRARDSAGRLLQDTLPQVRRERRQHRHHPVRGAGEPTRAARLACLADGRLLHSDEVLDCVRQLRGRRERERWHGRGARHLQRVAWC